MLDKRKKKPGMSKRDEEKILTRKRVRATELIDEDVFDTEDLWKEEDEFFLEETLDY
jgi:hypothetical protein